MTVYLDCNATTPVEPRVADEVMRHLVEEYGNAGSRTHDYGVRAKRAVQKARAAVAGVVDAAADEVIFTSGATEANNLAILGLGEAAERRGHVVTTAVEHKAVLEPVELLASRGFDVNVVPVGASGAVDPEDVRRVLRPDTLLVSVMHVNNETGVVQPLEAIAAVLEGHPAYFHVDGAQGFGKELAGLRNGRIDLISVSAHKVYGPKGVGALVGRRRQYRRPPLAPLMVGGGQERGLRPGTLPVALIAGFGLAAELAVAEHEVRREANLAFRQQVVDGLSPLEPRWHGDRSLVLPTTANFSVPRVDGEAALVALKDLVALSNGSACTSSSYAPSHVLTAMGLPREQVNGALRVSWCHLTEPPDWGGVVAALRAIAA